MDVRCNLMSDDDGNAICDVVEEEKVKYLCLKIEHNIF